MRAFTLSRVFAAVVAVSIGSVGTDLLAQDKGKGRGGDSKRGQRAERSGDDRGRGRSEHPRQDRAEKPKEQRAERKERGNERRVEMQQQRQIQQAQRQQQRHVFQQRGDDRRVQMKHQRQMQQAQRQQQAQQVFQQRGNDRRVQMQQQRQVQQSQRQQSRQNPAWPGRSRGDERRAERQRNSRPQIIPQQKVREMFPQIAAMDRQVRRSRDRDDDRREDRVERTQRNAPPFTGNWPVNYGQQRRAEVHARNAERRAMGDMRDDRREDRDDRRNSRNRDSRYYASPGVLWQQTYIQPYAPNYRPRTFYDSYVYPQDRSYTYTTPRAYNNGYAYNVPNAPYQYHDNGNSQTYYAYDDYDRPSGSDILRNVIFAVLGGGMRQQQQEYAYSGNSYDPGYAGGYSPVYTGRDAGYYPTSYASTDPSYYDPYFTQDPYYAEVLPIQHFVSNAPGGGLFRQMFTQLLAIGYEQGYQDGIAARQLRERDRTFYDPYAYDNAAYDPYSVSLGDNRRSLSEGYGLGYEDAIDNERAYDQFGNGGVDLVSLLIGAVSQLI